MGRLLAILALLPGLAFAEEVPAPAIVHATTSPGLMTASAGAQLVQLLVGLVAVVALIFLLAWLVRRVQQVGPRSNQVIRVLAAQPLGPRDRLVLVQVGDEQILLGLTPGRITPLHVMQEPVHLPDSEPASPDFARGLLELLNKDKGRTQ